MRNTAFPVALIVFGAAWLAWDQGWLANVQVVFAFAVAVVGLAILITEGINRTTVVSGPILIYIGLAWYAHIEGYISYRLLWPVGVIVLGLLLLISRLPGVPPEPPSRRDRGAPPPL